MEHVGRAWTGHLIEDECPCPQEACGLVSMSNYHPDCGWHTVTKTIRQGHAASKCPGKETILRNDLRNKIARSLAVIQNADYFYDLIDEWESWSYDMQLSYPDEYPGMAYEDLNQFLEYADRLIEDLGLEKWDDGPSNTKVRYMTRWYDRDGI